MSQTLVKSYGLWPAGPVMCRTELVLFHTAEAYYLWNEQENLICKITDPTTFDDILAAINKDRIQYVSKLKMELLHPKAAAGG